MSLARGLPRSRRQVGRPRFMSQAPATHTAAPSTDRAATCSFRTTTPSTSATGGMRKAAAEARVDPTRPAAIVINTNATPVPRTPNASNASTGPVAQWAWTRSRIPSGAVNSSAAAWAHQITGRAPFRCWSGRARLEADQNADEGDPGRSDGLQPFGDEQEGGAPDDSGESYQNPVGGSGACRRIRGRAHALRRALCSIADFRDRLISTQTSCVTYRRSVGCALSTTD
jgi:hypothetical protein